MLFYEMCREKKTPDNEGNSFFSRIAATDHGSCAYFFLRFLRHRWCCWRVYICVRVFAVTTTSRLCFIARHCCRFRSSFIRWCIYCVRCHLFVLSAFESCDHWVESCAARPRAATSIFPSVPYSDAWDHVRRFAIAEPRQIIFVSLRLVVVRGVLPMVPLLKKYPLMFARPPCCYIFMYMCTVTYMYCY